MCCTVVTAGGISNLHVLCNPHCLPPALARTSVCWWLVVVRRLLVLSPTLTNTHSRVWHARCARTLACNQRVCVSVCVCVCVCVCVSGCIRVMSCSLPCGVPTPVPISEGSMPSASHSMLHRVPTPSRWPDGTDVLSGWPWCKAAMALLACHLCRDGDL